MSTDNQLVSVGGSAAVVPLDTDVTLATDSDLRVPTQKAVKRYVDTSHDTTAAAAATGFSGTGTVVESGVQILGGLYKTTILIDLTGAKSSTTDLDIIGNTGVSYITRITTAVNGLIMGGSMTCLEAPTTGVTDIDLYSATEATGAFDGAIGDLAETAIVTAGGAWTRGLVKPILADPAADSYLYLTCGAAGVPGTYDAGRFLIELWGR